MSKFILGSFAAEIIRSAKCPVLTIGPNAKPVNDSINIGTVLFATDLEHQTAEKAAVALAFAEDSLAKILLCHVVDHPTGNLTMTLEQQFTAESALKRLIPSAAYEWCDPEVDVEYGDPGARILRLAEKVGADLIVLGAHKASHRFPRFPEGVANSVIEKATCPVLTICSD